MAEVTDTTCGTPPLFKKWDQGPWLKDNTCNVKAKTINLQFDGGVEHKDGTSWSLGRLLPPLHIVDLKAIGTALGGATFDLGFISCEAECGVEPCVNLTQIFGGEAFEGCKSLCGTWQLNGDTCAPDCCPKSPNTSCCPEKENTDCGGMSNLILTIHGTPPACSELQLTFLYTG